MALIAPDVQWVPLGTRQSDPPMTAHDVICLHTMVGYLVSTDRMWRPDGYAGLESHFGIGGKWGPDFGQGFDGRVFQWQDLRYQADANLYGNPYVISIETADNAVEPIEPWTVKQLDAIVRLCDWLCSPGAHQSCPSAWVCHHSGIPRRLIPHTIRGVRGIGYHRQGIMGNYPDHLVPGGVVWSNKIGKTCPTDARIAQIKSIIIPRLNQAPTEVHEVPYYTTYTAPGKPPRVFVDGAVVGFPNPTELAEFMAPFDKAGYEHRTVQFAEVDDWQRFMDGHFARLEALDLRVQDIRNQVGEIHSQLMSLPEQPDTPA